LPRDAVSPYLNSLARLVFILDGFDLCYEFWGRTAPRGNWEFSNAFDFALKR